MAMTRFGKELRKYRIDHDMIMKDMAVRLGIGVATLSKYEHGKKKLDRSMFEKIKKVFNLDKWEIRSFERALEEDGRSDLVGYHNVDCEEVFESLVVTTDNGIIRKEILPNQSINGVFEHYRGTGKQILTIFKEDDYTLSGHPIYSRI